MKNNDYLLIFFTCLLVFVSFILLSCSLEDVIDLNDKKISRNLIAHKGSWWKNNLPPNSTTALQEALALDIYGVEFDVCQTIDGVLVIYHNENDKGIIISQMKYSDMVSVTGRKIPTLEDFLSICQMSTSRIKLLLDLKNCNPTIVLELVESYSLEHRVEYLSFNRSYCDQIVKRGYGQQVFYLGGDYTPSEIQQMQYGGISYSEDVLSSHLEWINEAHNLGLKVHVWTVNRLDRIDFFIKKGVAVITDIPC